MIICSVRLYVPVNAVIDSCRRSSCSPDVLTVFLATLAIGFHCLQKIKITPEIGELDLKEKT